MTSSSPSHRKLPSEITCKAFSRVSIDATLPTNTAPYNDNQSFASSDWNAYWILHITFYYVQLLHVPSCQTNYPDPFIHMSLVLVQKVRYAEKCRKFARVVLVQKVRYFLGKVAQDRMFAEPHLICVEHFLPAQSNPANFVVSTTTEMVCDFTTAMHLSPDILQVPKPSLDIDLMRPLSCLSAAVD